MADPTPDPAPSPTPVQAVTTWRYWMGMMACMFICAWAGAWIVRHFDRPLPVPPVRPFASISGPDVVQAGTLVEFESTGSNADQFIWDTPGEQWRKWPDGSKIMGVFPEGGRFNVGMAALAIVDKKIKTAVANHPVLVTSTPTPVPPEPNPTPPVPPAPPAPLPPGRFGLSAQVVLFASSVTQPSTDKKTLAAQLASNFDSIATQVAAGTIKTPQDLQVRTEQVNIATQGSSRAFWTPFWASLAQAIKVLDGTQIKTMADFADAWREIAAGLRGVR